VQEKLTAQWIDRCLEFSGKRPSRAIPIEVTETDPDGEDQAA
jgi:hypothetical protein